MPELEDLDFDGSLDEYVKWIQAFIDERGDRLVHLEQVQGHWVMGILTKEGLGISMQMNYTE